MQDLILATKLQPPQMKGKILRRQRLLNLLNQNLDKKLILICADAGYGKTTLLTQFCSEIEMPFMFYDLDASDNDIAAFFNYLVSGIQRHYPDFGQRTKSVIPQTRNIEIVVGTFINELVEKITRECYIILDDYHHLQQSKEICNALDYLLRHLPHNLHFIISSRSTPPLNLAYYLAKQELFKIEKEQLQFNMKEIQELLKEVYGLKVPDTEIERIEKHSEGWVTAIQLILQKISASGEEKAKETLNGYISSGEEVLNYFSREVFESQPKEIQNFLVKTSALEEMNAPLCNYLIGTENSNNILSWLETEHVFTTKIGDSDYRYHPLFRGFLNKRLEYTAPSVQVRRLYQKTGQYFSRKKDYLNAARYFLDSEYYDQAAKILSKHQFTMHPTTIHTFAELIDQIPPSIIDRYPELLLAKSKCLSYLGKWDDALQIAIKAKRTFRRCKDHKKLIGALQQIGFIYLVTMQPFKALMHARKAYVLANKRNYALKARIMILLGNIYRALAQYHDAENSLNKALSIARRLDDQDFKSEALKGLARLYSERTDFNAAVTMFTELFVMYGNQRQTLTYANLCANAAALYIEIYDFDKANELLDQAAKLVKLYNDKRTSIYLEGIRGKFYFYKGENLKALECYARTLKLNKEIEERLAEIYAKTDLLYIYLKMNKITDAKSLLRNVERLISNQTPPSILIDLSLVKGCISQKEKNVKLAEHNFRHALEIAVRSGLHFYEMKVYYLLARLHFEIDSIEKFDLSLKRCFEIAQERVHDFFLITEAKENWELFRTAMERDVNTGYLSRIFEKVDTAEARKLLHSVTTFEFACELEISLFGRVVIKNRHGDIVSPHWKTQKTKALFVYLIVNQGELLQKDHLLDILWPEKSLTKATHSLHDHISFVRRIFKSLLGPDFRSRDIIGFRNPFYSLTNDIRLKIDVCQFENLMKKAAPLEPADKDKAMEYYKNALDLYHGDFCPELYENWAEGKRSYYRVQVTTMLKKLAEYHYDRKNYEESVNLYKSALGYDNLDETVCRGIMRCLRALGDNVGVKKQYEEFEKLLKKDLNVLPSMETQKLYHELLGN